MVGPSHYSIFPGGGPHIQLAAGTGGDGRATRRNIARQESWPAACRLQLCTLCVAGDDDGDPIGPVVEGMGSTRSSLSRQLLGAFLDIISKRFYATMYVLRTLANKESVSGKTKESACCSYVYI